ncbi:MAG: hypothetical protein V1926_01685 [Candidatus Peregrinibacteria bacterium]
MFLSLFVGLFTFLMAPSALAEMGSTFGWSNGSGYYGTHAWNVRVRRAYSKNGEFVRHHDDWYYMAHPDYTKTYALHPYYRKNYYDPPVTVDDLPVVDYGQYLPGDAYVPERASIADCDSYSFSKPNYRVAPYGYECED